MRTIIEKEKTLVASGTVSNLLRQSPQVWTVWRTICIALQSLDIRAMRWQAALHQFQKLPDFAAMNNENGWPSGLPSSDQAITHLNEKSTPDLHPWPWPSQHSTGVLDGSSQRPADAAGRPGQLERPLRFAAPARLISSGLAHTTPAPAHARQPARRDPSSRRGDSFWEGPGISRWTTSTYEPQPATWAPAHSCAQAGRTDGWT